MDPGNYYRYPEEILKSPSDGREYRALILNNRLKVLLAHEPDSEKSFAALTVAVGSMNDPSDLQGLAHLCEHMLFFESVQNARDLSRPRYSQFISENGGNCNAFTVRDQTNFHFDVSFPAFKEALTRFSKFFTEPPAFPASALEKEINIVNSEHENNITNDAWRKSAVESCTSRQGQPYRQFTTGNRETLWTIPKEKSINVQSELKYFHETYYSANLMSLAVIARESLDDLQELVVSLFSKVVAKKIEMPRWPDSPYGPEECGTQIDIQSLADVRDLYICFPIPDTRPHYKTFPHGYITNLLGHKGSGSLFSALYSRNWVNNNYLTSSIPARGSGYLSLGLQLTLEGMNRTEEIVNYVFQYIKMLRKLGPQEYFWEELRKVLDIQFRFQEKENPLQFVQRISNLMHVYPLQDVVSFGYALGSFDASVIIKFLNCLTPRNCRILRLSKNLDDCPLTEKFYGVKYNVSKISAEHLEAWEDPDISTEFHLPFVNEFIPSRFDLKSEAKLKSIPTNIEDSELNKVWFYNENGLQQFPKGFVRVELFSPLPMSDPDWFNLMHIICLGMKDLLMEVFYDASLTGMNYTIKGTMYGAEITVDGFDEKIMHLLKEIIVKLINFTPTTSRFRAVKDAYENGLANRKSQQPHLRLPYHLSLLLREKRFTNEELLLSCQSLTTEMLERFRGLFFEKLKLEWLFYGNFLETDAIQIVSKIQSLLETEGTKALNVSEVQRLREIRLKKGSTFIYEVYHSHKSACSAIFLQIGIRNQIENVLLDLLDQVIYEPCFNQLRNTENLGYIVKTSVRISNGTQGLLIVVQGNNLLPEVAEARIIAFLNQFNKSLDTMSPEEFQKHKAALITRKLDTPKKIWTKANRIWNNEIYTREYQFNRTAVEINLVKAVSIPQFTEFALKYIDPGATDWKCLILNLLPGDRSSLPKLDAPEMPTKNNHPSKQRIPLERIFDWKTQMGIYPLLRPTDYN